MSRKSYLLLFAFLVINGVYNSLFQLHYDEAYYWVWGQQLSLSYFDHAPMVAYLIRLFGIFGHSEFWVRFPAVICMLVTLITIYKLSVRMFNNKVAEIALVIAFAMPVIQGSAFIITPDSPLIMFWGLTLYSFYLWAFESKKYSIYWAGIWAGCAMLSKYTSLLIFPGLFLFLLTSNKYRLLLLKKDIYLAFVLAFVVAAPVIIWNYQHDWVSILYQFHHGVDVTRSIKWDEVGNYLGGEVGFAGPFIFIALLYYIIRYYRHGNERLNFLFYTVAFGFLFFLLCSFTKHIEGNWPGPIYTGATIMLAYYINLYGSKWIYKASFILICLVLLITKNPEWFVPQSMQNKVPGINILYGNKELLNRDIRPLLKDDTLLLGCDYGNASRAWFYLDRHAYVLPKLPFSNAYRFWPEPSKPLKSAIYFCDSSNQEALKALSTYFKQITLIKSDTVSNSITDTHIDVYQVAN